MSFADKLSIIALFISVEHIVWKWWSEKSQLRIDLMTDMAFEENFLIRDSDNKYPHAEKYISIEIANIGKFPTTIKFLNIQL